MKRIRKSLNHVGPIKGKNRLPAKNGRGPLVKNGHAKLLDEPLSAKKSLSPAGDIAALENYWHSDPRWQGVTRSYTAEKVLRLRGTMKLEHTIADQMSHKLWDLLHTEPFVPAL